MRKFLLLFTIILLLGLKSSVVYSIQLATFVDKDRAISELENLSKEISNLFMYRTDRGYWTIRVQQENNREIVERYRESSTIEAIKRGVVVPSDISKISSYKKSNQELKEEKKDYKISPFFEKKIDEQKSVYKKIDTYTFRLRVGQRIYVVQFSENPDSQMAQTLFEEKPKEIDLNVLIVSNSMVQIPINLGELDASQDEVEDAIIPILDKGRRSKNIRVKAYRVRRYEK